MINWIIYVGIIFVIVIFVKLFLNGSLGLFLMLFIFMLVFEFFILMRILILFFYVVMIGVLVVENIIFFVDLFERNIDGNKEFKNENEIKVFKLNFLYLDGI